MQSRNTQKAVAPGTEGDYTFSLQNSGKRNVQYKVWFEADSNFSNCEIPLEFRISGSNGWMDRRGKWLSAEEFSKISEKKSFVRGEMQSTRFTGDGDLSRAKMNRIHSMEIFRRHRETYLQNKRTNIRKFPIE